MRPELIWILAGANGLTEELADMMIARKDVPDRLVSFLKVVPIHSERDIDRAFRCR